MPAVDLQHEPLRRVSAGNYRTHDDKYEVRQVPTWSGRADAGTWHVGYTLEEDPTNVEAGLALSDSCRTMAEARDELAGLRESDG